MQPQLLEIKQASQIALESAKDILNGNNFSVEGFDRGDHGNSNWVVYVGYNLDEKLIDSSPLAIATGQSTTRRYVKVYMDGALDVQKILPYELDR